MTDEITDEITDEQKAVPDQVGTRRWRAHVRLMARELVNARADLREAVELLRLARGRFQSYEECDQDYCADGSDHEPRARMDALLAKHKETP